MEIEVGDKVRVVDNANTLHGIEKLLTGCDGEVISIIKDSSKMIIDVEVEFQFSGDEYSLCHWLDLRNLELINKR